MITVNKKILKILGVFSFFLILIGIVKNETRIIEKQILINEKELENFEKKLFEAQLEYYYLSSPAILSKKIEQFTMSDYVNLEFSQIYFNIEHFLNEKKKITKVTINEK